ncbi:MAG: FAD:protein FMN transferase [Fimbriimonadaceae bacterium]
MPNINNPSAKFTYTEIHMGGELRLTFYASDQSQADQAAKAAYVEIERLEQIMSDYRPSSEIRQLKPNVKTKISDPLFEIITIAQKISAETDGAFDITAGPAVKLWRNARATGRLPGPIEVKQALKFVDYRQITLDPTDQTITVSKPGFAIDLGGIAKGYACDAAIRILKENQISQAIVQAGGDIAISNPPPNQEGWQVQIPGEPSPRAFQNCAISTSGDTEQFIEFNGNRYSHIVDPRTGIGVTNRVMATVIAKRGAFSDPLATAHCVQGIGGITDTRNP